jgi:hypothetical protein
MRDALRWIPVTAFVLAACTEGPAAPEAADGGHAAQGASLSAAAINEFPFFEQFDDVNPCSGLTATITITGAIRFIDQDGRELVQIQEQLSTSDGFTGRGTVRDVFNGRNEILHVSDMLSSESGARYTVKRLLVVDVVNDAVRVTTGGPVLTCLR